MNLLVLTKLHFRIRLHAPQTKYFRARMQGQKYRNPYDLGFKRNWQMVFGNRSVLTMFLPSTRQPPWPPWPRPDHDAEAHIV